ncbi:MAG: lactate dehydrogenase [Gallionella sp.]|nr:lactate dehydrogenase [Gallionella sp.]
MNIAEIEFSLKDLVETSFDADTFIYRFLAIYDAPKATVTKLRQGTTNQAKEPGDLLWNKKLFFRIAEKGQAAKAVDAMADDPLSTKHAPRFLFATDGEEVYCHDTKVDQTRDISFDKLNDVFDFFLPLAGIERYEGVAENPADIKATARLAKLYDAILEANPDWIGNDHTHELNLFMTRMLFCFFAEDTSIFVKDLFTSSLMTLTREDGTDTSSVLETVFSAMNTPDREREELPEFARRFPFVNGGLFHDQTPIPKFSKRARRLLKECGDLSWRDINPDIFGSMIQAVVEPGMRGDMGMHYTSVPNIMKVLQPLFLMSLEEEFEAARDSEAKLQKLLQRIYHIRIFDPACGSGNFLIIAYRELRKLESRIFERQKAIARQWSLPMTGVRLTQFFGIELTDFAAETAKLSLWIAEYQFNELFKAEFGSAPPALPLRDSGNIVHGNACRLDWMKICPCVEDSETYIVGNPPYLGRAQQTSEQKADIIYVFKDASTKFKKLDYVACWVLKGAKYCQSTSSQCAFVTTNSICQGEQVALLWPLVYESGLEIGFAHQSFKWRNNAAKNAGVICIVVSLRAKQKNKKVLISGDISRVVDNISPYLTDGESLIVYPISNAKTRHPKMQFGNMAADGGNLLLTCADRSELITVYPDAERLVRRFYGSQEFIRGNERWCLWIEDCDLDFANTIPPIASRILATQKMRSNSIDSGTRNLENRPHQFREMHTAETQLIIVPSVSSERRYYLPTGVLSADAIVSNLAFAVYDAPDYLFSVLSSRLQAIWTAAVGGHMKTDYRYSNTLVYNTFPLPELSADQKAILEEHAVEILGAREAHPGKTIAWLYDPETMPANLLKAHKELDDAFEQMYIGRPFKNDTERLEYLFKLYANMIKKEQAAKAPKKQISKGAA